MRGIRGWSLVLYKIIINFLFSPEIIHPVTQGSNTGKWALGSPWLLNIAVIDVHNPGSELCTFTSCSFSSYITFRNFAIAGVFFPEFQHPVQHKSTSAVTPSLDGSLSERPRICLKQLVFHHPPFEEHVGWVRRHPWKSSVLTSRKIFTGFLTYENEGFSLFCFSYFLPFFNGWVTIFPILGAVATIKRVVSQVREMQCILFPLWSVKPHFKTTQ